MLEDSSGRITFAGTPDGWSTSFEARDTVTITDGNWHYVTMTYDTNGDAKLYIDGALRDTNTNAPDGVAGFDVEKAGWGYRYDTSSCCTGEDLDEWGFWTDVITLAEHQAMYASGSGVAFSSSAVPKDNLYAYYDFEQTGTTLENKAEISISTTDQQYSVIEIGATETKLGITENVDVTTTVDDTTTGLLGLYKFDDTSGDYVNSAGTLGSTETLFPDFTYEAGSYSQTGVIGDSIHMNGRSGESNVNFDWNAEDWTVSVWCSLDSGVSDNYRGCIGNRFGANDGNPNTTAWWTLGTYAHPGGQWFIETSGGDIRYDGSSTTDATGDGFHHWVLVHDASGSTSGGLTNGELRVYQNNALVDTLYYGKHGGTHTFEVGTTGNYLAIGKWSYSGTGATDWVGNIDSLMIWNYAIDGGDGSDTTKIGQLYDSGSGLSLIHI